MKAAFHFNANHPSLSTWYGYDVEKLLFGILLNCRNLNISSKILTGDLLLHSLAYDVETISANYHVCKVNSDKYFEIRSLWLRPEKTIIWSTMIDKRLHEAINQRIFIVCFETMEIQLAEHLDAQLQEKSEAYLGGLEVYEASYVHWCLYSNSIGLQYRIINNKASVFWDGLSEESKDECSIHKLTEFGFRDVEFESLNGKGTFFDEYHNFEQARRVAEWKKHCGNLLAFIADDVAHKLGDAAPELGNKLWSMLKTFNEAETNEQFAQVTASCRRILEYISDQLFPPIEGEVEGRKLGTNQYRNRLLAFADNTRKSDTNIDCISISTKSLSEQMERLAKLTNKGVHSEVYREETRRCLLRTIMLLDDLISLKVGAFEIKTKQIDFGDFFKQIF